jgi:CelD/BcsL family acetyltransferase involved in cellulose biosynthesis
VTSAASLTVRDEPLDAVRDAWQALLASCRAPAPFVTPAWQRVWLDHFQDGRQARIFSARDGERLLGVAPMLVDGERAEFVGHYSICDYMDIACEPGAERALLGPALEALARDGVRTVDLRGLHEASATRAAVRETAPGAGYAVSEEPEALSPAVDLPATWEEYLGLLSKKDRHELRRKLRRLESAGGDVQLEVITEASDAAQALDWFFELMRASSHHKEEFLERPGMEAFFREMTRVMAEAGMLRMYALTFDAQPVAAVLNFDLGGRLYMYNSGYDPQYAHYAVGLMSKALLVRDAIACGRTQVDFLRGDESYKYDLGGKDRTVYRMVLTR